MPKNFSGVPFQPFACRDFGILRSLTVSKPSCRTLRVPRTGFPYAAIQGRASSPAAPLNLILSPVLLAAADFTPINCVAFPYGLELDCVSLSIGDSLPLYGLQRRKTDCAALGVGVFDCV